MTDRLHGRGHGAGQGARPLEPGGDPRLSVCHDSGVILSRSYGIGAPCTWRLSLYKATVPQGDISTVRSAPQENVVGGACLAAFACRSVA